MQKTTFKIIVGLMLIALPSAFSQGPPPPPPCPIPPCDVPINQNIVFLILAGFVLASVSIHKKVYRLNFVIGKNVR